MSVEGRSAQGIVHDVREELAELCEAYREKDPALTAKLADISERLARLQGLTAAPTTSSYRHQVHMFQRWLREQGRSDDPPLSSEVVLEYLRQRSESIAAITLRKDAMGIRRWHQAEGLADPTDDQAIVGFFTALGQAWMGTSTPAEEQPITVANKAPAESPA